jgi:hypothetical protein
MVQWENRVMSGWSQQQASIVTDGEVASLRRLGGTPRARQVFVAPLERPYDHVSRACCPASRS